MPQECRDNISSFAQVICFSSCYNLNKYEQLVKDILHMYDIIHMNFLKNMLEQCLFIAIWEYTGTI